MKIKKLRSCNVDFMVFTVAGWWFADLGQPNHTCGRSHTFSSEKQRVQNKGALPETNIDHIALEGSLPKEKETVPNWCVFSCQVQHWLQGKISWWLEPKTKKIWVKFDHFLK